MKKKIIPVLFSLFLLASCGEDKPEPCPEGKHQFGEWIYEVRPTCSTPDKKYRVCSVCKTTERLDGEMLQHEFVDSEDQSKAVKATCKDTGTVITKCKNCGEESFRVTDRTETHTMVDAADQTTAITPNCKEEGTVVTECSVCGKSDTRSLPKTTTHTYVDAVDQTGAYDGCVTKGKVITECSICGAKSFRESDPIGHNFESELMKVNATYDLTAYSVYDCPRDHAKRLQWYANEYAPSVEAEKYNNEPNIKTSGDGIMFWGRPIGNKMALNADGGAQSRPTLKDVYDADVPGSFIEYNINVPVEMKNVQLSGDMSIPSYTPASSGFFLADSGDWTPGLLKDKSATDGFKACGFRYVIDVNGERVTMDASKNIETNGGGRNWYNFPCKFDLKAGVNTIRLSMAGGYNATFYGFAVESDGEVKNFTQPSNEFNGYKVTFQWDENVEGVSFYKNKACTVADEGPDYITRNAYGRPLNDGEGQISFGVTVKSGFRVKNIGIPKDTYKNIKGPADTALDTGLDNIYRITKITQDVTVTITTEPEGTVTEGYKFTFILGEHVTGIEVYSSPDYSPESKVEGLIAESLSKTSPYLPSKEGDPQIFIKIFFEDGFELNKKGCVVVSEKENPYNEIKKPSDTGVEDGYKFTKVCADATVTIAAKSAS